MIRYVRRASLAGAAVVAVALAAPAARAAYDAEYVFGDSLSDRGNLAEIYGVNFPSPPSNHDSFTNGPVAVQLLAQSFGLNANPSLWVTAFHDPHNLFGGPSFTPGTNYAVAGATSAAQAVGGPPNINLPQQVAAYGAFSGQTADPNALYVVDIGGNDVRNAALQGTGAPAIAAGVQAELAAVATLAGEGAKNFLVVNVPNVGAIPEFAQYDPSQAPTATSESQSYDAELASGLAALEPTLATGTTLDLFDLYGFNTSLLADAASYGFTDLADPCFTNTPLSAATTAACGPDGANIAGFIYWDSIHPTAKVQALWAEGFEASLTGVPEGSTLTLLAGGLAVLAVAGGRVPARRRA